MAKFGDIGREVSDDEGHVATFMVISATLYDRYEVFFLDDEDPIDKTLIGGIHWSQTSADIEWIDPKTPRKR